MSNSKNLILLFIASIACFTSCKKDSEVQVETENFKGIVVVNEGSFGKSNGSIGIYKPGDKSYFDAFKKANDRPLGDIVQSMALISGNYYIVVNNSNKIEVVGDDFKSKTAILVNSPRYVQQVSASKAYISSLFSNDLFVMDIPGNNISSLVQIHHESDVMAMMDEKVYISTFDNKIMVVDAVNHVLTDSIPTPSGLSRIVNAGSDKIAVLCTGLVDWNNGNVLENGKILIINKDSMGIEKTVNLSSGSYGGSMIYVSSMQALYFSLGDNKIYKMDMNGSISTFLTMAAGNAVYSLTYNSAKGEIYVSDAGDFNSAGKVFAFDMSGNKTLEFTAGIAPNGVLFKD